VYRVKENEQAISKRRLCDIVKLDDDTLSQWKTQPKRSNQRRQMGIFCGRSKRSIGAITNHVVNGAVEKVSVTDYQCVIY
jgi:hypothetical protein